MNLSLGSRCTGSSGGSHGGIGGTCGGIVRHAVVHIVQTALNAVGASLDRVAGVINQLTRAIESIAAVGAVVNAVFVHAVGSCSVASRTAAHGENHERQSGRSGQYADFPVHFSDTVPCRLIPGSFSYARRSTTLRVKKFTRNIFIRIAFIIQSQ